MIDVKQFLKDNGVGYYWFKYKTDKNPILYGWDCRTEEWINNKATLKWNGFEYRTDVLEYTTYKDNDLGYSYGTPQIMFLGNDRSMHFEEPRWDKVHVLEIKKIDLECQPNSKPNRITISVDKMRDKMKSLNIDVSKLYSGHYLP